MSGKASSPARGSCGVVRFEWDRRVIRFEDPVDVMEHASLSPVFLTWVLGAGVRGRRVLDLGCGDGRLTFALASHAGFVVGLDRDAEAIARATARAGAERVANVRFFAADVEAVEYGERLWGGRPDVLTAHLCMSDAIVTRAGRALAPGSPFAFVCFHKNQWKESGRPSRFSYAEEDIALRLEDAGFRIERGRVEEEVVNFASPAEAEGVLFQEGVLPERWKADGRTKGLRSYLHQGGREFTRKCHILVLARKAACSRVRPAGA